MQEKREIKERLSQYFDSSDEDERMEMKFNLECKLRTIPGLANKTDRKNIGFLETEYVLKRVDSDILAIFYRAGYNRTREFFNKWKKLMHESNYSIQNYEERKKILETIYKYDKNAISFEDLWDEGNLVDHCFPAFAISNYSKRKNVYDLYKEYVMKWKNINKEVLFAFKDKGIDLKMPINGEPVVIHYSTRKDAIPSGYLALIDAGMRIWDRSSMGRSAYEVMQTNLLNPKRESILRTMRSLEMDKC